MANPQLEDGHTDIAHELVEALAKTQLSGYETRVLWAVLRKSYGWHKKTDRISYTQFEQLTGLNRRHVATALKRLIIRRIITEIGNGYKLEYGLQKDYTQWKIITEIGNDSYKSLPKSVTKPIITEIGNTPLPKSVTKSLPKSVNTKEKKETIQKKGVVPHTPKISNNGYISELQKYLGFPERTEIDPIPNPAKEAKFIKTMLTRGFTWLQIFDTWRAKVDSRGEFVSMVYVNEDIGKKEGGNGAHRRSVRDRVPRVPKNTEYKQPDEY